MVSGRSSRTALRLSGSAALPDAIELICGGDAMCLPLVLRCHQRFGRSRYGTGDISSALAHHERSVRLATISANLAPSDVTLA